MMNVNDTGQIFRLSGSRERKLRSGEGEGGCCRARSRRCMPNGPEAMLLPMGGFGGAASISQLSVIGISSL
jgi:hypothetical protein